MPSSRAGELAKRIDSIIKKQADGELAQVSSDAEFLRRIYLDLNGIIPTYEETVAFLDDRDKNKRTKLIDILLNDSRYAVRMREAVTVMLLERRIGTTTPVTKWNQFLESAFSKNKPWDQVVREIITADAGNEETYGSLKFFTATGRTVHDQMTQDVARLFLGMNIHCAKCHDHPSVDDYKQSDYFGLLAFLNQTKTAKHTGDNKTYLVEGVSTGKLEFQSVFEPDTKHHVGPRLPGLVENDVHVFESGDEFEQDPKDGLPGIPKFRPRMLLAQQLASSENKQFVQNSVNRFWYLIMGRGLVHPLEMIHSDNPPSHPELLELLSAEFANSGFDVKHLIREIVLSDSYQRSSQLAEDETEQSCPPESYKVAISKGLTPEQAAWSIMRATGVLAEMQNAKPDPDTTFSFKDYINDRIPAPSNLQDTMTLFVSVFGSPPGVAEVEFQPSMGQALFLMNEKLILEWLKPREGRLIRKLEMIEDDAQVAKELYVTVYSRYPTAEEAAVVAEFLEGNSQRRTDAIAEFAWAMITSAEFRLNH